jgi:SAM-dependent methyltransferase
MDYDRIAHYYDRYVNCDLDFPFFIKESKGSLRDVLELMSGTGRLSLPLIEAGVNLTCVDSSSSMLQILRNKLDKRGFSAPVFHQDICELNLREQFDLIIIPFHSFAELSAISDQIKALHKVHHHLADNGRFICTLHNPSIRLKTVTGQLRLLGRYPFGKGEDTLLVWSAENYNSHNHIVEGVQIYEEYDAKGEMRSRMMFPLKFCLLERTQFEDLAEASGFKVLCLYGDYSYSEFKAESSPVMVFTLHKCLFISQPR